MVDSAYLRFAVVDEEMINKLKTTCTIENENKKKRLNVWLSVFKKCGTERKTDDSLRD